MIRLILQTDKRNGLSFCEKRLTSDKVVFEDIAKEYGDDKDTKLFMDIYSGNKFINATATDFFDISFFNEEVGGNVFVEIAPIPQCEWQEIVVYEYNQIYPFDKNFIIDKTKYRCSKKTIFEGDSHKKITKRIYSKKKSKGN